MKLFTASASPFGRKAGIVIAELALDSRVQQVAVTSTPVSPNPDVAHSNPLVKIPTLVLDDGTALYDSPVICEYLDHLSGAPRFFPAAGQPRWRALRRQALGDGLMDAAILMRYEAALRPEALRWPDWVSAQQSKVRAALDTMEAEAGLLGDGFDIGHVAFACAAGYLDLRFGELGWRNGRPALAAWFARISERPSLRATMPHV